MNTHQPPAGATPFWRGKTGIVLIMLLAIGLFYLAREHFSHIAANWPYLILLICPLMHIFGHGHGHGHGGHGQHGQPPVNRRDQEGP
ncbi:MULTISPECIES: DUF2933 domain-containing protein [unclassified Pseudomonas]|uniref:DUF2933 domain-containing protein n=1 Tax=unclassified Pseudomonas TaxID=196821 RepID=UPI000876DE97|nr:MULTISPECIES: DUF2933 domain-containing protein [unclassified Pseudomonas]SCZ41448.1 Protein of unknown function [Pseudomonas sp. NFACC44-2]SDA87678.1 Protein of unknown function [Pseudomonas sp. NFACC51]SFH85732.1 Protein of unknown function [Pseudomonas sp. NFACC54]SFS49640.1 Protein of unknown function [Pseudomonas sp. NFACC48-1]